MSHNLPKRILVILSRSMSDDHVAGAPLLETAGDFAKRSGAEISVLNICYDDTLSYSPFAARSKIDAERSQLLEHARSRMSVLTEELSDSYGVAATGSLVWNDDRCAAILEAAAGKEADLVMKERGDHEFLLGLFSNTDWDLLRRSEVPVWFVAGEGRRTPEAGIVAAVDYVDVSDDEQRFELDHRVFEQAQGLSRIYESPLYVVHAYSVPRGLYGGGYMPMLPAAYRLPSGATMVEQENWSREIAERHGQAVQAFVDEYGIPLDDLTILEGPVPTVLRQTADSKNAGLIVMGATSKDRWARLLNRVSAEPTLADAGCDVLFVKLEDE